MDIAQPTARQRGLLLATSLGFALIQLDVSVVNVAIQSIGRTLGTGVGALQWVVNAYTLTLATCILTAGTLGDRLGAKRLFVAGFFLFTLSSAACGLAPTVGLLITARVLQGLGGAILWPCSLTLINHAYINAGERTKAVGIWAAGASVALAGGPLVGGILTSAWGWRAIFFINVPLGAIGIWATLRYAAETTRQAVKGIDVPGQVAAVAGLVLFAGAVISGGTVGQGDWRVLVAYTASAAIAVFFVRNERRQRNPMLPPSLFRSPVFTTMTIVGLCLNVGFYGLIFVLSIFFQQAQHLSPLHTGILFAPMMTTTFCGNLLAPRLARRLGAYRIMEAGVGLAIAGTLFLFGALQRSGYSLMLPGLLAIGLGLGLIVPLMTSAMLQSVVRASSGVASGTLNMSRQAGSVVGVALFGSFIARQHFVVGLRIAIGVYVALLLGVLHLCIRAERSERG